MDEQEYVTLDDAAKLAGMKKPSIYYYLRELDIKTRKFTLNKHAYIAREEAELIKQAKQSPWKISQIKEQRQTTLECSVA